MVNLTNSSESLPMFGTSSGIGDWLRWSSFTTLGLGAAFECVAMAALVEAAGTLSVAVTRADALTATVT